MRAGANVNGESGVDVPKTRVGEDIVYSGHASGVQGAIAEWGLVRASTVNNSQGTIHSHHAGAQGVLIMAPCF